MQGTDYTGRHAIYDVAKHFCEDFIEALKEVAGSEISKKLLEKHVYSQSCHRRHRESFVQEILDSPQESREFLLDYRLEINPKMRYLSPRISTCSKGGHDHAANWPFDDRTSAY